MGGQEMKTNMINQMLKVTLLVAIFATIQVPTLCAQSATDTEVTFTYSSGATMEVGDSVMIHQDSLRYLTGERMSKWVYGVPHEIRQLGTKSKPMGVLLRGIYSWISQGSLIPLNVNKTQEYIDAQRAAEEAARQAAEEEAARLAAEEAARQAAEEEAARLAAEEAARLAAEQLAKDTVPAAPQPYQVNRFTVGVRGGLASLLPKTTPNIGAAWGLGAMLDLQYAHYWSKAEDKINLGIMTGLGLGYVQNSKKLKDVVEQYTLHSEGDILYNITMDEVNTVNRQLQLEIPLMFSMVTPKGFFLNVGPKFILPVYTPYAQSIKEPHIQATLLDLSTGNNKVVLTDNVVMGRLEELSYKGMNDHQFDLTIALGGELGYEHQLESGHSVSVGLYANYGVYSTYKHDATSANIVSIVPPSASGVAQVTTNSVNNAYVQKLGYLDAGLKVAFHLNWKK